MDIIINTLIPIFLLILLGYFFKKIAFPSVEFWTSLDRFNYYVLFPSLLVYKLWSADISGVDSFDFIYVAVFVLLFVSFLLIVFNHFKRFENSAFTSIYQGGLRFNTYVFLSFIAGILGDDGLVIAALLITFVIPLLNLLCIAVFSYYVPTNKIDLKSFIKSIFKNPLILACIIGGGLNFLDVEFPIILKNTLSIISVAALPLGLLSVGVGLSLYSIKDAKFELFVSSFVKLIILPFVMYGFGLVFGLSGIYLSVLVVFATMPTASSAYILAKELGGDTKLISAIISLQTILSIFTIGLFMQFISF